MYEEIKKNMGHIPDHKAESARSIEIISRLGKHNVIIKFDEDIKLMIRVAKGDEDAFNIIYSKYFPLIADHIKRVNGNDDSSEDIANEVFTRLWQKRDEYKPLAKVKTYLFSFVGNVIS